MIHGQKKGISTRVNKLSYCLALHGWLLLPSSERMSLIISLCSQAVCFLCWFCKPLFVGQCYFAPIQSYFVQVMHYRGSRNKICKKVPWEWLCWLHYKIGLFSQLFLHAFPGSQLTISLEPLQQGPAGMTLHCFTNQLPLQVVGSPSDIF